MRTRRVRTDAPHDVVYPNVFSDFDWIKTHEKELRELGNCVILVFEKKGVGKGATIDEAMQNAENQLPDDFEGTITSVIHFLADRHTHFRLHAVRKLINE